MRSQTLFISSAACSEGTAHEYTVNIAADMVVARDDEVIKITLQQFSYYNAVQNCNATNNLLKLTNLATGASKLLTVPPGSYPLRDLAKTITALYGDPAQVYVSYQRAANALLFTCQQPHRLEFVNQSYSLLGFRAGETPQGTTFQSSQAIDPIPLKSILVHLQGVTAHEGTFNLCNVQQSLMNKCDILMAIPVGQSPPYTQVLYSNTGSLFGYYVGARVLSKFRIRLTDFENRPLPQMPHHHMTLRIDYVPKADTAVQDTLSQLLELQRMQLVAQNM